MNLLFSQFVHEILNARLNTLKIKSSSGTKFALSKRMKILVQESGHSPIELIPCLALVVCIVGILVWVLGDNQKHLTGRFSSSLSGREYEGRGPTQITKARTRKRTLKNFDDARIRQDQYTRFPEPKKSRKRSQKGEMVE